jgi:hypothetical protein
MLHNTFALRVAFLLAGQLQETALHSKEFSISNSSSRKHNASHLHVHEQQHHLRLKTGVLRRLLFPKAPAAVSNNNTCQQLH